MNKETKKETLMDFGFACLFILFLTSAFLYFYGRDDVYITAYHITQSMLNVEGSAKERFMLLWTSIDEFRDDIVRGVLRLFILAVAAFSLYGIWGNATPRSIDYVLFLVFFAIGAHWLWKAGRGVIQEVKYRLNGGRTHLKVYDGKRA